MPQWTERLGAGLVGGRDATVYSWHREDWSEGVGLGWLCHTAIAGDNASTTFSRGQFGIIFEEGSARYREEGRVMQCARELKEERSGLFINGPLQYQYEVQGGEMIEKWIAVNGGVCGQGSKTFN